MIICFEGANGTGKREQAQRAIDLLRSKGRTCILLYDPGIRDEEEGCQKLRRLALYEKYRNPLTSLYLHLAARGELNERIRVVQRASSDTVIILDRYELSTYAYQSLQLSEGSFSIDEAWDLIFVLGQVMRNVTPDLLIYLDVPPEAAYGRRGRTRRETDVPADDQYEARGPQFARDLQAVYRRLLGRIGMAPGLRGRLLRVHGGPLMKIFGLRTRIVTCADKSAEEVFDAYRAELLEVVGAQ